MSAKQDENPVEEPSAQAGIERHWQVRQLAGSLGAEVRGLSLAEPSDAQIDGIRRLLHAHMVLFFPGQAITVEQHVALGERFGPLEDHPNLKNPFTQYPKLFELAASQGGIADEWHTDITFDEHPAVMSILHMVQCPSVGGDTMWSNLNAAYNGLSKPLQSLCDGLTALHDALPHNRPDKMAIHPVVRRHPVTNARALYVNEHFTRRIVELSPAESRMLLDYLTRWVTSPAFTVRYHWQPGTIAFWDNRCTQHFVLNDFEGERIIQRVTVMGDRPEGDASVWPPFVRPGPRSATSRHDRQLQMFLSGKPYTLGEQR